MRSFVRRRGLPHERRKANLAEPHAPRSWSPWTAKKFVTQPEKQSFSTQSAYSVEKLPYSELIPNLAEQNSELHKFQRRHRVQSTRQGTTSRFSEICRCSKEFFNKMGGKRRLAASANPW